MLGGGWGAGLSARRGGCRILFLRGFGHEKDREIAGLRVDEFELAGFGGPVIAAADAAESFESVLEAPELALGFGAEKQEVFIAVGRHCDDALHVFERLRSMRMAGGMDRFAECVVATPPCEDAEFEF